jgi:hypothetical protein
VTLHETPIAIFKSMKGLKLSLLIAGLVLLILDFSGMFLSLRNDDLTHEITPYKNDISLSFPEARKQWHREARETDRDFALRMNRLVNQSMAHYWKDEGIRKYHMQIPFRENYILALKQRLSGEKKYEFINYRKAIERGVGICSQPCIALQDLLFRYGIKSVLWDLKGHVVVEASFSDGSFYMLDPDYGKFVPLGMAEIQANPELVRESYKDQDSVYNVHLTQHKHTNDIVDLYEKDGNHVYKMDKSFEDFSYIAKWLLPLLLFLPFAMGFIKKYK